MNYLWEDVWDITGACWLVIEYTSWPGFTLWLSWGPQYGSEDTKTALFTLSGG